MRVFLVGYMLCGKSTVGKKLAKALNYEFVDTDRWIENKYRLSVEGIFEKYGQSVFRMFERQCLESLSETDNVVIATGGGLPCFGDNMDLINSLGFSIYLKMPVGGVIARYRASHRPRPLLKGKTEEELQQFICTTLQERELYYRKADIIVAATDVKVEEIISKIPL